MVGSNKILTVSYGTFSCTLEGFEDSFGTMKAIAEYFRDLAADDRYFGAEPPVPDVEMLGRIAEREVARRVEARIDASGITLRTGDALPAVARATPVASPVLVAPDLVVPALVVQAPEMPISAMSHMATPKPADAAPAVVSPTSELAPATIFQTPTPMVAAADSGTDLATVPAAPLMPPAVLAPVDPPRIALTPTPRPVAPASPTPPVHPDTESVAAKLQRIRAVVGRGLMPAAPQNYAEDQGDEWLNGGTQTAASAVSAAVPVQISAQTEASPAAVLSPANAEEGPAVAGPVEGETQTEDAPAAFDLSALMVTLAQPHVAADSAVAGQPVAFGVAIEPPAPEAAGPLPVTLEPAAPEAGAPAAPVRARVIRMRRAAAGDPLPQTAPLVLPAAQMIIAMPGAVALPPVAGLSDPDSLQEDEGLAALEGITGVTVSAPEAENSGGTLSADDEAALLAELAAVEQEAEPAALPDEPPQGAGLLTQTDADIAGVVAATMAGQDNTQAPDPVLPEPEVPGIDLAEPDRPAFDLIEAPLADAAVAAAFDIDMESDRGFDFNVPAVAAPDFDSDTAAMIDEAATNDSAEDSAQDRAVLTPDAPDDAGTDAPATAAAPPPRPGRDLLEREPEADAVAMQRILTQTDAELNAPDSSRRRDAIAQLKAAVAATEAARRLGEATGANGSDAVENAFRDDLKQVVRPRRPMAEVSADLRSERPRPAPLKLVASQRIDVPQPRPALAPAAPVRPRRVSVDSQALPLEPAPEPVRRGAGSFAAFAESVGAKALPDLLEAAAAYTSFVEGVEDFSRPQLMKKVQDMTSDVFSREDGLRSFGTLLRQGRIVKTRNGRFQVNEESRFNPERRAG